MSGARRRWHRPAATTALAAAVAVGLRDVFEPPDDEVIVEEIDVSTLVRSDAAVVFQYVRGAPTSSRAIVRPWLLRP